MDELRAGHWGRAALPWGACGGGRGRARSHAEAAAAAAAALAQSLEHDDLDNGDEDDAMSLHSVGHRRERSTPGLSRWTLLWSLFAGARAKRDAATDEEDDLLDAELNQALIAEVEDAEPVAVVAPDPPPLDDLAAEEAALAAEEEAEVRRARRRARRRAKELGLGTRGFGEDDVALDEAASTITSSSYSALAAPSRERKRSKGSRSAASVSSDGSASVQRSDGSGGRRRRAKLSRSVVEDEDVFSSPSAATSDTIYSGDILDGPLVLGPPPPGVRDTANMGALTSQYTWDPPTADAANEEQTVDPVAARLAAEPAEFLAALKTTKRARKPTVDSPAALAAAPVSSTVEAIEDEAGDGYEDLSSSTVRWPGAADAETSQELGFLRSERD